MKTVIKATDYNRVTISYTDEINEERITMHIKAPIDGGYVRDQNDRQVCDGLDGMGNTLTWDGKAPLVDLVRREYRRMRQAEKRTNRHWQ